MWHMLEARRYLETVPSRGSNYFCLGAEKKLQSKGHILNCYKKVKNLTTKILPREWTSQSVVYEVKAQLSALGAMGNCESGNPQSYPYPASQL